MRTTVSDRVKKHRASLKSAGLRPIQIWVPDTRLAEFAEICRVQSLLAAEADRADAGLDALMDTALADVGGWSA